jgi:hypothetical protein
MLTKDDKGWLATTFVTRAEHSADIAELKNDVQDLKHDMGKVLHTLDKIAVVVDRIDQENKFGGLVVARHTRQIEALAQNAHLTLPD